MFASSSIREDYAPPFSFGPHPDWHAPQLTVSPGLFTKFQRLIHKESGIWLGPSKAALLCGRLSRRLRALEVRTLEQYYELVAHPSQHYERVLMIDAITTNETHFFREPGHFEFLAERVFPLWRRRASERIRTRKVHIWSAGCSSGEEPYSLAMWLAIHLTAEQGWEVQILATDISTRVLIAAREAIYDLYKSADIPGPLLRQFMLKGRGEQEGRMKVSRRMREMVQFERLNLSQGPPPAGSFDLIFCRNVLIYFGAKSKQKVLGKFNRCLSDDGFFFTGHAENLNGITFGLRTFAPTIYCKSESHHRLVRDLQAGAPHRS